ncbi:hypothetical protein TNCV_2633471 [Trichonephila clavipes]|nr:hypothetical protein TNCV_2633471 [Trichonephila clavipes]
MAVPNSFEIVSKILKRCCEQIRTLQPHLSLQPSSGSMIRPRLLVMLTALSKGLSSKPGESMDVCKCIMPLWHGDTLNSHRAASPLVRLMEGEES